MRTFVYLVPVKPGGEHDECERNCEGPVNPEFRAYRRADGGWVEVEEGCAEDGLEICQQGLA
jgi:hypothetical protein